MVGTGGGAGGGTWVRTKGTPDAFEVDHLDLADVGVRIDGHAQGLGFARLIKRLRISRALPQPSLFHWVSIQGTRLCSSSSGNSARCRLAINRKIAASSFGS